MMNDAEFAIFYDKQADYAGFRNDPEKLEDYRVTVDLKARNLVSLVPEGMEFKNILEGGCALGVVLNNLADRLKIADRTGIDISFENIKTAQQLFPGCKFFRGTIEDFIKSANGGELGRKFDLVILSDIVEHIPDDLGFLKEVSKVADHVLFNLPLEKAFKNRNRVYGETDPSGHLRWYNRKDAEKLVEAAGFKVISAYTRVSTSDPVYFKVYSKNRAKRIAHKPLPLKIFWTLYYFLEDNFKKVSQGMTARIYGTNYFALLEVRKNN